jgi:hypothetical protein
MLCNGKRITAAYLEKQGHLCSTFLWVEQALLALPLLLAGLFGNDDQCEEMRIMPDYIFSATGTGGLGQV